MMAMRNGLMMTSALAAGLMAAPAMAQVAADQQEARPTGDIVVTAQKREQTVIDVAQSLSVIQGDAIERQSVNGIADFLNNVPSLQLVQSTPGQGRLVLRGVNTGGVASTVAVYLDETPFGSSSGLANGAELAGDFDTFDIDRIEVLRGPQGTLYGASSLGGLLKYVTNAPNPDSLELRARANAEDTEGGAMSYQGNVMANIPLSDTLAFRASGSYRKQGGFIDSIGTAGSDVQRNINDYRNYGGRASLAWTPTDALSVRASALLQNIEVDAATTVESDPETLKPLYGGLTLSQYVPSYSDISYRLYNVLVDYDFGPVTLTSSTSYSAQRQRRHDDATVFIDNIMAVYAPLLGVPAFEGADAYLRQRTNNRKWTQELRLASSAPGMVEWLIGGYYTHEKALIDQLYTPVAAGTLDTISYIPEYDGLGGAYAPSTYKEYAAFANATVHLGERFDVDLGGRYSYNKQRYQQIGTGLLGATPLLTGRSSDNVFTYSVAPKIKFGKLASLYARVAKGYRPGGPNLVPPGAPSTVPATFDPDTVTSYEIGFKGETRDRTFGIEAAIYHIDWSNIQLLAVVNNYGVNVNGASADIDGAEATVTIRPIPGFTTTLNGAYTRAVLAGDTDPQLLGAVKGDRLPFTAKFAVSINSDYEWAVSDGVKASIGGTIRSLSGQSGNYDAAYRSVYGHFADIPAYELVDLRAGVDFGRFAVQAYVRNVFNTYGITGVSPQTSSGFSNFPGNAIGTGIVRPRTIGLSLTAGM
jgi:outer membrane receptor protein involved in Fe transport